MRAGQEWCLARISERKYSDNVEVFKGGSKGPSTDDIVSRVLLAPPWRRKVLIGFIVTEAIGASVLIPKGHKKFMRPGSWQLAVSSTNRPTTAAVVVIIMKISHPTAKSY